ncbi:sodium-dependent glucose transporter 1B-like [Argopecten irradians]|uniref:sodium-dependent glucose transporter 1B-like n=1 Tax=Argopecten irradians TaxID=31199 RepID=UPI003717B78C
MEKKDVFPVVRTLDRQGWLLAQTSTALLDLQEITSVSLAASSLYVTFLSFGFVVGSFTYGVACSHVNKFLIQFIALVLASISMATIPWCNIHAIMILVHAVAGFCNGILDAAVNAEMLAVWGNGGRRFMQAMYFSDSLGGVISPLVTAPFLSNGPMTDQQMLEDTEPGYEGRRFDTFVNSTDTHVNGSLSISANITRTNLQIPAPFDITRTLSPAYAISSCIIMIVAIAYLFMFIMFKSDIYSERVSTEMTSARDFSKYRKLIILINMGLMTGLYIAIEESFSGFLPTFCTKQLSWSKSNASYALCVLYSCIGLGRFAALFWVTYVNLKIILGLFCFSISIALGCVLLFSEHSMTICVWISVAVTGFVFAIVLPTIFTWTEEDFFPVTGVISSYFNIAADCGATINPVIIGTLMEHFSPMWFLYVLLAESALLMMTYAVGVLLSRQQGTDENKYQEME